MMWNCPNCKDGIVQDWRRQEDCDPGVVPLHLLDAPCSGCGKGEKSMGCHRGCGRGCCGHCLLKHSEALTKQQSNFLDS